MNCYYFLSPSVALTIFSIYVFNYLFKHFTLKSHENLKRTCAFCDYTSVHLIVHVSPLVSLASFNICSFSNLSSLSFYLLMDLQSIHCFLPSLPSLKFQLQVSFLDCTNRLLISSHIFIYLTHNSPDTIGSITSHCLEIIPKWIT